MHHGLVTCFLIGFVGLSAQHGVGAEDVLQATKNNSFSFEVVGEELSKDGRSLTLRVNAKEGIFHAEVDLSVYRSANIEILTIIVENVRGWEGVNFITQDGKSIDMKNTDGAVVFGRNGNCVIEAGPGLIDVIRHGGVLQFIDFYRG